MKTIFGLVAAIILLASPVFADSPVISGASDITAEATSSAGAFVSFNVTATDATGTPITVTCTPPSASTFALGTTAVSCSASNSIFATTTATFNIGVVDTAPPIITPPADQAFSTTTIPASPTLARATAADLVDHHPVITSDAPSSFPIGTTTVTWTATDASDNSAATTSLVVITDSTPPTQEPDVLIENDIVLPNKCDITDTAVAVHAFPTASSSSEYLGICALAEAKKDGYIKDFSIIDYGWGLWLDSINGVATSPDWSSYWALSLNGVSAQVGIADLAVTTGDTIRLEYASASATSSVTLHITALEEMPGTTTATTTPPVTDTSPVSSGGGGGGFSHTPFNVSNAIAYLNSQQAANGTLNNSALDTDWATFAYGAYGATDASRKLVNYLRSNSPILVPITDFERHAMALEAMGINPYTGSPTDTITPIVKAFDGTQIGDPTLVSDDIFALFPLLHAGYSSADPVIQKTTAFILSKQSSTGSWDGVDMTAAAVQALADVRTLPGVTDALARARTYLSSAQQQNGGFGNDFSTSWTMQAIAALGEQQTNWVPSQYDPQDYLAQIQQSDGGMESVSNSAVTRTWSTAYAVPAVLGKTWGSLLTNFSKPASSDASGSPDSATSAAATSTLPAATSTPLIATSTLAIATSTEPVASSTSVVATNMDAHVRAETPSSPKSVRNIEMTQPASPLSEPASGSAPQHGPQTAAAAADASSGNFLGQLWHSIVSFFGKLF